MLDAGYERQVELLLRCLPEVGKQSCYALKGGTAINLFLRDMPRLSVDIDLTYLPLSGRDEALQEIGESLGAIAVGVERHIRGTHAELRNVGGTPTKLMVSTGDARVKIEPNLVLRGTVYPPEERGLCEAAQQRFEMFVSVQSLSTADLYAGKICAALDRQHPRDLYDLHLLLRNEVLTPEIRRAFVVYLAGHSRPMHELLDPNPRDIQEIYDSQFVGMVRDDVPLEALCETREQLVTMLRENLDEDEKRFLLSMKRGEPEWDALGFGHLADLPSLQWKLINIRKMDEGKRRTALERLERVLRR